MNKAEACAFCGEWFNKSHHNQRYCCDKCKKEADRRRYKKRYFDDIKSQKKNEKKAAPPSITIDGMVALMMKLSKERGYVVQYGEVQQELFLGKLKV